MKDDRGKGGHEQKLGLIGTLDVASSKVHPSDEGDVRHCAIIVPSPNTHERSDYNEETAY